MINQISLTYRAKILISIGLSLSLIYIFGAIAFSQQHEANLNNFAEQRLKHIEEQFQEEIKHKTNILIGVLGLLESNVQLGEELSKRNKEALFTSSIDKFQNLQRQLGVSHFYFHDLERKNILRVHNPNRSGDIIDRFTLMEAEVSGKLASGLELGPFGTFTLRVVAPWSHNLIRVGYLELGIDVHEILRQISHPGIADLYLAIPKSLLDRSNWEIGQRLLGHQPNWEEYPNIVVSLRHGKSQNHEFDSTSSNTFSLSDTNIGVLRELDNKYYFGKKTNINNSSDSPLGELFVVMDLTKQVIQYNKSSNTGTVVYIIFSVILFFVLYRITSHAQKSKEELQITKDRFEELATFDQLTKLPNRQLFKTELSQRIKEARRFEQMLAVCFIDLDNFKVVNDTLGHDQGDILIQKAAKRMSELMREYDVFSRFGGDEFVLMMPRINSESDVEFVMEKILTEMARPIKLDKELAYVTMSAGISIFPNNADNSNDLLRFADAAMYEAKEAGRNKYRFFTNAINDALLRRQKLEAMLRNSIEKNKFKLHYQPQIDLGTGKQTGCEALIRWHDDDGEEISPSEFIPIAERTDLIVDIGNWVIEEAFRQCSMWKIDGKLGTKININISGRQLLFLDLYDVIFEKLKKYNLEVKDIGIELTENVLIQANEKLLDNLQNLIDAGMEISVDDFGTGYSSLSYLKKFPVSTVKIDKEFIRDAPSDMEDRAIIIAIVAMGHSLGLKVVAEGVETEEQYQLAMDVGCDLVQGYYTKKPLPAEKFWDEEVEEA